LHDLDITLEPLTALIGPNGVGKSSTVRAVEFLFGKIDVDEFDCTEGLPDQEVTVSAVFTDIPASWAERLAPWLGEDGTLTINRTSAPGSHGTATLWTSFRNQIDGFGQIRRMIGSGESVAEIIKPSYQLLRGRYTSLPAWQSKQQILAALEAYEQANPDDPRIRDADRTLGFAGGGEFDLTEMIELLVLPAFRDAADDASDGRGSNLGRLVELAVRSQLDLKDDLEGLAARTAGEYQQILDKEAVGRLEELSRSITVQLETFAPGASVHLSWDKRMPSFTPPGVRARLRESGYEGDIGRQGHGVQRAYVFSLLRALLEARQLADPVGRPAVVLVVEEPEVYQHPVRARYVARILAELARNTGKATQIICTTHSPYFVSVDNIPAIRLLGLHDHADIAGLRVTRAAHASLDVMAGRLEQARDGRGQHWTADKVAASLPGLLGTDVSEGLFADAVVLVEGEEDAGMIDAAASAAGVDFSAHGTAVIAVRGKDRLRLAAVVFEAFSLPLYLVFDTDITGSHSHDSDAEWHNGALTWLADGTRAPRPGTQVTSRWASAHNKLRAVIDEEIGADAVASAFRDTAREMSLPDNTEKNGHLVRTAVSALYSAGFRSQTLDAIIKAVHDLRAGS